MGAGGAYSRFLGRPVDIYWAGWKTTARDLQHAGWQIAVDFDPYDQRYKLLLHHEQLKLWAISSSVYFAHSGDPYSMEKPPPFHVEKVSPNLQLHHIEPVASVNYHEIDAEPILVESPIKSAADLNIFRLARNGAKEILIDRADMSVVDHLEAIQKLQAPKQAELREKARCENERSKAKLNLVAQLISVDAA